VNAYVTPVFEGNQVVGYESVRVKPTAEQIRRAEALYQRINQGKSADSFRDKWLPVLQDWLPFILVSQLSFVIGATLNSTGALPWPPVVGAAGPDGPAGSNAGSSACCAWPSRPLPTR
jgi:hypothetical protein